MSIFCERKLKKKSLNPVITRKKENIFQLPLNSQKLKKKYKNI
jgi:hypothetical protein